jgi:hypothetical protein
VVFLVCKKADTPATAAREGRGKTFPFLMLGLPGAKSGKFTVGGVAEIITLWPSQENTHNSWKIKART